MSALAWRLQVQTDATSAALADAKAKKELADANAIAAKANEEKADRNAAAAKANEEKAARAPLLPWRV